MGITSKEDDALSTPRTSVGSSQKDNIYESRHEDTTQPSKPFWTHHLNDEKEYDRQLRQHYVLKHILNGNIHVPIPSDKPVTILNAACGAGFWTLDMAYTFPHAQVMGFDAFDAKKIQVNTAPNIVYKDGDITKHMSLPDNCMDLIFQRDTSYMMPHERWPLHVAELFRIVKPGGYIELVEYNFNVKNPGPVLALVNEWYRITSASVGVDPKEANRLKRFLLTAGFQDVCQKTVSIPIGEWPASLAEKEKGFLYKQVVNALFKSMKTWWITELRITEKEYDKVVRAALDEIDEQSCSIDWIIYTAQKPRM
ncbi:S-adenosyl-L-methionine-dependent methyltransferase [Mucor mucedo]|uniref:S-adenosyl-L-methionine-dependent methyltransferase n=1 Tax=Mucor mucedo TaxID=29922 RepID=UPI002220762A|nr:S-adenosyl-L-methionine-dependent methyltransferase [Mucor mucedo]KAI7894846.1 S-adenosyl-L-methionine-dependent methyltransferase [Mucor mucedo]